MERFFVLKPPVETTEKAWFTASKRFIPASIKPTILKKVMPK